MVLIFTDLCEWIQRKNIRTVFRSIKVSLLIKKLDFLQLCAGLCPLQAVKILYFQLSNREITEADWLTWTVIFFFFVGNLYIHKSIVTIDMFSSIGLLDRK